MTTYIEHETALADANVSAPLLPLSPVTPLAFANPMVDALPGLVALWSWPLTAMQIWSQGWLTIAEREAPPVASHSDEAQLPMPKPARSSFA